MWNKFLHKHFQGLVEVHSNSAKEIYIVILGQNCTRFQHPDNIVQKYKTVFAY